MLLEASQWWTDMRIADHVPPPSLPFSPRFAYTLFLKDVTLPADVMHQSLPRNQLQSRMSSLAYMQGNDVIRELLRQLLLALDTLHSANITHRFALCVCDYIPKHPGCIALAFLDSLA